MHFLFLRIHKTELIYELVYGDLSHTYMYKYIYIYIYADVSVSLIHINIIDRYK